MEFSIVLPYLSSSKTVTKCKNFLEKYTTHKYELVEIVDNTDVYAAYNEGTYRASNDIVILMNDDMYVSAKWDELYLKYHTPDLVLTGVLVEPGVIPVSHKNVCKNFGTTPESFNEDDFVTFAYALSTSREEIIYDKKGWYMPIMFNKKTFIPYPNDIKYPHANDITLVDKILPEKGFKFAQVSSVVYHLQNFSARS